MLGGGPHIQVVYLWRRRVLGYRLVGARDGVTVGPTHRADFVSAALPDYPRRFRVLRGRKDHFRLRLGPGMEGQVQQRGQNQNVADILAQPLPKKLFGSKSRFRDVDLFPGDAASLVLDPVSGLRLQISFVDPPERIGRLGPGRSEPLLLKTTIGTAITTLMALLALLWLAPQWKEPGLAITAERFARIVEPMMKPPRFKAQQAEAKAESEAKKKKDREAAESKRMKGAEGKLGRADAKVKDTVMPKGREDILREKVQKTGLLAVLGTAKAQGEGSGLGRLLTQTDNNSYDQALNGLEGAKLVAGKGSGGMGTAGVGLGGGGTGFGRIQGSGDVDVGAGRGRGRKGPGLHTGKEKEVSVGMDTGNPDAEGGLSKEQINRVVRAHAAALKYCYEKELQRHAQLSGKVELYWVIRPNGAVDRVKIAASTLGNRDVEGCMERQVRNWQFPRSSGETIVQSYPFLFRGGS